MVECRHCQKKIDADKAILLFDMHYVCSDACQKQYQKTDMYYKDKLLDEIWTLCGKQGEFLKLKAQAEYYHSHYKFKYSGMLYAVNYWKDIEGNTWQNKWGLGQIFPETYNRALQYWHREQELKHKTQTTKIPQGRTIVVETNQSNKLYNKFKINIEEL